MNSIEWIYTDIILGPRKIVAGNINPWLEVEAFLDSRDDSGEFIVVTVHAGGKDFIEYKKWDWVDYDRFMDELERIVETASIGMTYLVEPLLLNRSGYLRAGKVECLIASPDPDEQNSRVWIRKDLLI